MSTKRLVTALRRLCIANLAMGLAVLGSGVPASVVQVSHGPDPGKSAGTGIAAGERRTQQRFGNDTGVSLEVPIGRVSVGPGSLEGETVYVRRVTGTVGMTIVEVSTTPFTPEASGVAQVIARPDQPAPW